MSSTEGWMWVHAWAACGWDSKWYALIGLAGLGLMGCVDTGALGSVSSPLGDREALVCEGVSSAL